MDALVELLASTGDALAAEWAAQAVGVVKEKCLLRKLAASGEFLLLRARADEVVLNGRRASGVEDFLETRPIRNSRLTGAQAVLVETIQNIGIDVRRIDALPEIRIGADRAGRNRELIQADIDDRRVNHGRRHHRLGRRNVRLRRRE